MTINRNNYETYFLLYIDNELSAAEKKAVELFVQQHTDLQQELAMLQQTVLLVEPVAFAHKNSLLKMEEAMQQKLLLHLDGELGAADTAALEKQLRNDTALQQEWTILQQTKLPQETVVFEHKELLLRKEPARIITARWWRVAAAVFIGFGLAGTILLVNKNKTGGTDVAAAKEKAITENTGTAVKQNDTAAPEVNAVQETATTNTAAAQNDAVTQVAADLPQNVATAKKSIPGTAISSSNNPVAAQQNVIVSTKEKPTPQNENNAIKERLQNFNKEESNETSTAIVLPAETISQPAANELIKTVPGKEATELNPEEALKANKAAYAINTKNDAGMSADYLAPDEKKNRRSGLLRKVSRFLQRSTKKKPDGDGLKIAGFEFAVR
jgi:hypothetical protein